MSSHQLDSEVLISHQANPQDLAQKIAQITSRIISAGDKEHVTVEQQLQYLAELSSFELGKYLILHQGINGYWTHYMLSNSKEQRAQLPSSVKEKFNTMEIALLDTPAAAATQERFKIFLRENQKQVSNNVKLASIPCGMLGELLLLDYSNINTIELTGIDYDPQTLEHAHNFATTKNLHNWVTLLQSDAWKLNISETFNLISSNGLNIYEPDDAKITNLYKIFHQALCKDGILVTSFLTLPTEWDMTKIDQKSLLLQRIIFMDILQCKFSCLRSYEITTAQLKAAGFAKFNFIPDKANIFPTVVAHK